MGKQLHIVAFDVPWPPDYGGVIDIFYKVKALFAAGCEIFLHCFEYGRAHAAELENYCKQVWYYPRITGVKGISLSLPYIVASRKNQLLLERLIEIEAPILFEGIHTTFYLNHPSLRHRIKAIRIHNIEHIYTAQLAKKKAPLLKKIYFNLEQQLLKRYEYRLESANAFFALSQADSLYFSERYKEAVHHHIPPFHEYDKVNILPGIGAYCLYHGNLSHPENVEAVTYLLEKVFAGQQLPLILAGMNPAESIQQACSGNTLCTLIANPSLEKMDELVSNAQIILLPTFQKSGVKLKLLNSLFRGRHLIATPDMLYGTGLQSGDIPMANDAVQYGNLIEGLWDKPFTEEDIAERKRVCMPFSNSKSAQILLSYF